MTEIASVDEVVAMLSAGSSISDADRGLIELLKPMVENACRRFVRHGITQPDSEYVEYYPQTQRAVPEDWGTLEMLGDRVAYRTYTPNGHILQLNNIYVRSITEVREDTSAYFDQGASDFAAATILTSGVDYFLKIDESGLSKSGELHRINRSWSSSPGTIKVTYNAGFTTAELDGAWSDIKLTVLEEIVLHFKVAKSRAGTSGGGLGVVSSQKVGPVTTVYDVESVKEVASGELSGRTQEKLHRIMRLPL